MADEQASQAWRQGAIVMDEIVEAGKEPKPEEVTEPQGEPQSEEPTGEVVEETGKKPYTPDEIRELLASDAQFDFDRLSDEGKLIFKSVDRGLQPKLQERGELKRELEAIKQQLSREKDDKDPLFDAYVKDPNKVLDEIYGEMTKAQYEEDKDKFLKLNRLKDSLITRGQMYVSQQAYSNAMHIAQMVERQKAVSDLAMIMPEAVKEGNLNSEFLDKLWKFTKDDLKHNEEYVSYMMNQKPEIRSGFLKDVYRQYKAKESSRKKVTKVPTKVEKAADSPAQDTKTSWTHNDYVAMRMKNLK